MSILAGGGRLKEGGFYQITFDYMSNPMSSSSSSSITFKEGAAAAICFSDILNGFSV